MASKTSIQIERDVKAELDKLKLVKEETYNSVITRVLKKLKEL